MVLFYTLEQDSAFWIDCNACVVKGPASPLVCLLSFLLAVLLLLYGAARASHKHSLQFGHRRCCRGRGVGVLAFRTKVSCCSAAIALVRGVFALCHCGQCVTNRFV
jgi:hypothetical protein